MTRIRVASRWWIIGVLAALMMAACTATPATSSPAASAEDQESSSPAGSTRTEPTLTPEPEAASIRLALPVPAPDPGQVWAFAPSGTGYFDDENLSVEFLPTDGGAANIQLVATGGAEIAISSPANLMNATLEGLDLVSVATVVTTQIFRFVVLPDSAVTDYDALQGGTIGVSSLASGSYPFAQFALEEMGLSWENDVEFLPVGTGATALDALQNGTVDALATWDTQIAILAELGQEVRILEETSNVFHPSDLIIVNREYLEQNEDVVIRASRAIIKSIVFSQANPDCAIDFFIEQFPEAAEARERDGHLSAFEARLENMQLIDEQEGQWGRIPMDLYEDFQNASVDLGIVREAQDLAAIMTNDYIDEITNFTVDEVESDAAAC